MGTAADLQSEWARLVVHSLVEAGIRDAVISPGSRSTPFTVAALEQAGLRCVSAFDERSAAHYAIGQARATGRPSLILCTSGSAPANYFPAVVEASEAGLPLLVLSADRPPELLRCGANQTTDQMQLYGRHVRFFAQLGEPRRDELSLRAVKRLATRSVFESLGAHPGPVHLNAQARKPLEPTAADGEDAEAHARVQRIIAEPAAAVFASRGLDPSAVGSVARALGRAERPLILCGPAPVRQAAILGDLRALADRARLVVAPEASSQLRFGDGAGEALGAFDTIWATKPSNRALIPDFVLQLGPHPTSRGWEQLCATHRIRRAVVHPWEWADPASSAELFVQADPSELIGVLVREHVTTASRDEAFIPTLRRAERLVWDAATEVLHEAGDELTEGAVARTLRDAAPEGSALVLGNSLPIRNFDTWVPPGGPSLRVFSQRGVSGIDGVVSGAAGVASCAAAPTAVLVGDVSFLHDINGLQLASKGSSPLVVVVVNNGGGRIFEQLPIARQGKKRWLPYFTTPHEANIAAAASVYHCAFEAVRAVSTLRVALDAAYGRSGCTVVEAVVAPHGSAGQNDALRSRVERAFGREGL
ncbi:MAG: 2-succinyl-5-enolpyruvyl-6-hydroxy-3-cyclohexene-1-carboxylic-acid synthase [Myxococcales bacterium]|nr:2-succinyl-5-enolpyruvyl-6-hydroxy-3-cyclohexene-1-carboxylic-acid synthase [Myxococcales bacterium]